MKKRQQEIEKERKLQLKLARNEEKSWKEAEKEEAKKKRADEKARHGSLQTRSNHTAGSSKESVAQPGSSRTVRSRRDDSSRKSPLIVSNQCCLCLQAFDEDIEIGAWTNWVQCICTRWLHEDCVLDCIVDERWERETMSSLYHIVAFLFFISKLLLYGHCSVGLKIYHFNHNHNQN